MELAPFSLALNPPVPSPRGVLKTFPGDATFMGQVTLNVVVRDVCRIFDVMQAQPASGDGAAKEEAAKEEKRPATGVVASFLRRTFSNQEPADAGKPGAEGEKQKTE
eukprot:1300692-Amphidinium_carterae.1